MLFPTLQPFISVRGVNPVLVGLLLTHSLLIAFYYFNLYYLIPRFFFAQRIPLYIACAACCFTLITLVLQLDRGFNPLPSPPFRYPVIAFIFTIAVRFMMISLFSMGVAHIKRLQRSEKEKLRTELSYLKAQINPHFLFNTLNSIYALTVKKSDAAPQSVTRLSSIMRYVISEAAHDLVPLEKEIAYISAYIDLEKLRLTEKVKLEYTVTGESANKQIAPLIFVALIENAFKHGVSTKEASEISIRINTSGEKLAVDVKNSKPREHSQPGTGLGLVNLEKRLNLLYPGKHILNKNESETQFSISLILVL